jgi:hypothetical protein
MRLFLIDGYIYAVSIYKSTSQGGMEMEQMKDHGEVYCCDWRRWWHGERRRRSRIGIFLIIIGGLWMGSKLGFFNPAIFWPLTFIAVGIWIIVSSLLRGKSDNLSK